MVMVALGTNAPDVSVTVPLRVAVSSCVWPTRGKSRTSNASKQTIDVWLLTELLRFEAPIRGRLRHRDDSQQLENRLTSIIAIAPFILSNFGGVDTSGRTDGVCFERGIAP